MNKSSLLVVSALLSGTVASVVSTAALAALAKAEGKRAMQPTNYQPLVPRRECRPF
jgi:hypothetical protein